MGDAVGAEATLDMSISLREVKPNGAPQSNAGIVIE
jgi:hypothetical protein